jgi:hypothetical protein
VVAVAVAKAITLKRHRLLPVAVVGEAPLVIAKRLDPVRLTLISVLQPDRE